jgi:hypothetical protein
VSKTGDDVLLERSVECPDVPISRTRLWAIMVYTQTRIGEARVFDVKHRRVKIDVVVSACSRRPNLRAIACEIQCPVHGEARELDLTSEPVLRRLFGMHRARSFAAVARNELGYDLGWRDAAAVAVAMHLSWRDAARFASVRVAVRRVRLPPPAPCSY